MKNNKLTRLLAALLAAVMLVPCVMAPISAAEGDGTSEQVFYWKAAGDTAKSMKQIKDNLILGSSRANTHYTYVVDMASGEDIGQSKTFYYLSAAASANYGLPIKDYGNSKTKATEGLKLEFTEFPRVITRGLEALNARLTVIDASTYTTVHALDKLRVQITVDGENWLDGTGIRSWKLVGDGKDRTAMRPNRVIEIQTENLLDIPGLKEGDRIVGIRLLPYGESYYSMGMFVIHDFEVTSFTTKEAFEKAVPNERDDLLYTGEQKMRDIVVEHSEMIAELEWTADADVYLDFKSVGDTARKFLFYGKGRTYKGPTYSRPSKPGYEHFRAAFKDGKYVGPLTTGGTVGYDCYSYIYDCIARVSRSYSWVGWQSQADNALYILGDVKHDGSPTFTDMDILPYNTEQQIYENYALAERGDILSTYCAGAGGGGLHIRIAQHDAVVVRNADGTIDPQKSYILTTEQGSTPEHWFRTPDGSLVGSYNISADEIDDYLATHPGYEFLYGNSPRIGHKYTFSTLYNTSYIALSLKEYDVGATENVSVQTLMNPKDGKDIRSGFHAAVAADYHVGWIDMTLEDMTTGQTLYTYHTEGNGTRSGNPAHQCYYTFTLEEADLNEILANLSNGKYRIGISVLAGPVTEIRADRPTTTHYYDFEITDSAPAAPVKLGMPGSVNAGQTVSVTVDASAAFDAADVEVKFDTNALTYKSGSVTPACVVSDVSADKGIVRIMAAGAKGATGQIARLTFEAKTDVNTADAFEIKSAAVSDAATANTSNAVKAVERTEVHSSINFGDVNKNDWFRDAVDFALDNGIMSGYNASTFGPNDKLSRAMVVQVLYNKEGKPATDAEGKFPDVKSDDWYFNATRWGAKKGVVSGYGNGNFGPNDNVTIEQVAVILHNYSGKPAASGDASALGAHSDWAAGALSWAAANGILKDVPYGAVTETATRAQTAQMLMNFLNK